MMKFLQVLFLVIVMIFVSCQNSKKEPPSDLTAIDFLRGDLALCGGTDFGDVEFAFSCKYATRDLFNLGISWSHSFDYKESEKIFVKIMDEDPHCPMAFCGVHRSIYHTIWLEPTEEVLKKGVKMIEIVATLPKSEREKTIWMP